MRIRGQADALAEGLGVGALTEGLGVEVLTGDCWEEVFMIDVMRLMFYGTTLILFHQRLTC